MSCVYKVRPYKAATLAMPGKNYYKLVVGVRYSTGYVHVFLTCVYIGITSYLPVESEGISNNILSGRIIRSSDSGLNQDLETGCSKSAVLQTFWVSYFQGIPQYTQIAINMYLLNEIKHYVQIHNLIVSLKIRI